MLYFCSFVFFSIRAHSYSVLYNVGHCSLSVSYIKDDDDDDDDDDDTTFRIIDDKTRQTWYSALL